MKKIKILIIVFVIIIIGILIAIGIVSNKSKIDKDTNKDNNFALNAIDKDGYTISEPSDLNAIKQVEDKYSAKVKYVDNNSVYFTVQALAENYASLIISSKKDDLKKVIAPSYIKKYNINDNNILKVSSIPKENEPKFTIFQNEIKEYVVNGNIIVYFVKNKGYILNSNKTFEYSIMIEIDVSNKLYNIYPEQYLKDKGYNDLKIGDTINYRAEKIENRQKNTFVYTKNRTDAEMARQYLYNYHKLLIYNKEEAYKRLESNYSKKRFENKDEFFNYLKENKVLIALMGVDQYKVEKSDNYTDYIVSDKYNNIYIFRQKDGIMNYNAFLDNYTIMLEEDTKQYNDADSFNKAKLILDRFSKMINTKDYKYIYNSLDKTFKANNFKTLDEFKKYFNNNFYDINKIEIQSSEERDNYYVFNCKLTNLRNTKENKNINVIISKTNDANFTMSFSF